HVFAALLAKSIPFTVRATHELVFADRQKIDMREGYEKFETVITAKHGDSFAKIREQIEPLLKTTGVKATNDNVKAAGILIKNKLDVTPGNITEIRLIDAKFSAIQDKLHPNIAAAMIKERMNPLDMHVDDVLRFIDGFNDEYGENARDKLAEHIRALDDAKTLTKEERGAMIAVYRALNAISKDDSAGLGLGLKYGGGLTLGDMLADARNFQRYGGESDDMLSRDRNDNIRQMLEDIPRKTLAECELNAILIDKISEKATPGALKNVYSNGGKHLELSEALEFMDDETYDAEFSDGQLTRMRAGLSAATELSVENLGRLAYSQAPLNVANMQAMALLENAGLGRMLDKLAGRLRDAQDEEDEREELEVGIPDGDLTALKDGESVENVLADISARLEDIKENITSRSLLDELILVQNAVMVQRHLCRNEPVTLPVRLSGGIAGLNMYVLDEAAAQGESVDLAVALDTPNLGQVKVFAKRSGESVSLEITAGSPRAEAALKRNIDFLRECLAAAGYGAEEIVFKGAPENKTEEKITIGENPDPPQTAEFEAKV
ncbi:MAG: flagellar hook-length control protein FliK, partial [Defluviitaleaceae bacterium]|nr:flagellar hook-length control protein FliK [Defluviitaleaceae bacterium]